MLGNTHSDKHFIYFSISYLAKRQFGHSTPNKKNKKKTASKPTPKIKNSTFAMIILL